jgi:epoxyqueuosine reductase
MGGLMKILKEPYYKKDISGPVKRFDDRNTGFARGVYEGNKYKQIYERGVLKMEKGLPGRTIVDLASRSAAKTVDSILRKTFLAREGIAFHNKEFKLKNPNPVALSKLVKEAARWFGADLVGVAELNPLWIYTHWGDHNAMYTDAAEPGDPIEIPEGYDKVVVIVRAMEYDLIQHSPDPEGASAMGYSRIAWSAAMLATYIRELGYRAIPCSNELGISVPMAIDAGLGESSRMGILITRDFGPRVRISKVFTDLPLATDSPIDIGVQKYCETCKRCAAHCPSQAIPSGAKTDKAIDRSNFEGIKKWQVNAMKCLNWWVNNAGGCSVCIRVCPWNKPRNLFHDSVRWFAERGFFIRTLNYMDELVGYGKQVKYKDLKDFQDPTVMKK